ncbi:hypothetical protein TDB9533_02867 [Thalassocella blandensis]|nr:hypothetical protein TDB9533_02867 [Thalassocella blandensis]
MEKVILTTTSFIRHDFTVDMLLENLQTVFAKNSEEKTRFDKIVIINEYSVNNLKNEAALKHKVESTFDDCTFYQKNFEEYGQATSLNLLTQYIDAFQFQVHWEEGWKCTAAFLDNAIAYMESSSVSQLGLTEDYTEVKERLGDSESYRNTLFQHLKQLPEFEEMNLTQFIDEHRPKILHSRLEHFRMRLWPLYSLRPCINRVSFTRHLPKFNTDKKLWPVLFELLYAFSWTHKGGAKACIVPHVATYSGNYKSSWRSKISQNQ